MLWTFKGKSKRIVIGVVEIPVTEFEWIYPSGAT